MTDMNHSLNREPERPRSIPAKSPSSDVIPPMPKNPDGECFIELPSTGLDALPSDPGTSGLSSKITPTSSVVSSTPQINSSVTNLKSTPHSFNLDPSHIVEFEPSPNATKMIHPVGLLSTPTSVIVPPHQPGTTATHERGAIEEASIYKTHPVYKSIDGLSYRTSNQGYLPFNKRRFSGVNKEKPPVSWIPSNDPVSDVNLTLQYLCRNMLDATVILDNEFQRVKHGGTTIYECNCVLVITACSLQKIVEFRPRHTERAPRFNEVNLHRQAFVNYIQQHITKYKFAEAFTNGVISEVARCNLIRGLSKCESEDQEEGFIRNGVNNKNNDDVMIFVHKEIGARDKKKREAKKKACLKLLDALRMWIYHGILYLNDAKKSDRDMMELMKGLPNVKPVMGWQSIDSNYDDAHTQNVDPLSRSDPLQLHTRDASTEGEPLSNYSFKLTRSDADKVSQYVESLGYLSPGMPIQCCCGAGDLTRMKSPVKRNYPLASSPVTPVCPSFNYRTPWSPPSPMQFPSHENVMMHTFPNATPMSNIPPSQFPLSRSHLRPHHRELNHHGSSSIHPPGIVNQTMEQRHLFNLLSPNGFPSSHMDPNYKQQYQY